MEERAEKILFDLKERWSFFSDLDAEFVFTPEESSHASAAEKVRALEEEIRHCQKCPLSQGRTHAVPGEGNIRAELMFVGEGPGFDEDVQGRPFVGSAGKLLTKIIEVMEYDRQEVYITNVVKCRPPNNRTPYRSEIERCTPYLIEQLQVIQPKVVVALGKAAADFFIPGSVSITELRGQFHDFGRIRIMPTFHPSYLNRNEGDKNIRRMVWNDMKRVMAFLGKK
ncbi:MAG: uracil-DNA glycosylase [Candidatus Aminicenantales bacterium]